MLCDHSIPPDAGRELLFHHGYLLSTMQTIDRGPELDGQTHWRPPNRVLDNACKIRNNQRECIGTQTNS
jgi:hypothetical protein